MEGRLSTRSKTPPGLRAGTELASASSWARSVSSPPEVGDADAGGGPASSSKSKASTPPHLPQSSSGEEMQSLHESIQLFRSAVVEPYEMVFADPPSPDRRHGACWPGCGEASDAALDCAAAAAEALQAEECDVRLLIRNLDTGEVRRLGDGALSLSFAGAAPQSPLPSEHRPWRRWWQEKRQRDEQLWSAAASGDLPGLRSALQAPTDGGAPADVNSKALYGRTALHIAAAVGKLECLEALLDAGACISTGTDAGYTALHVASEHGQTKATKLLLDWGSDPFAVTDDGCLALHLAAQTGHKEVVGVLLEGGGSRQLSVRNNVGQVAQEVSMDFATEAAFRQYASALLAQSQARHGSEQTKVPSSLPNGLCSVEARQEDWDALEAASAGATCLSAPQDRYSGRTPFGGAVLLHNARADMVRKLLDRTGGPPIPERSSGMSSPETPSPAPIRSTKTRGPFVRVKQDKQEVEQVGPDSFVMVKLLGRGSFGEVFQVKHKRTGQIYAMKILQKRQVFSRNLLRYAMTERNVLSYVRHPYIVSLYYAFQTSSHLVMVLKYCPHGNMQTLLDRERRLKEPIAQLYSAELILALGHLHERRIVFRDLKPENVVLDEARHCMLTDFGLSKEGVMGLHGARSFCGSVAFLAPEILKQRGHGHTVDIYGMGVMLFDMLTGQPPFYHPDRETLYTNIRQARLKIPSFVSRPAASLIEALMNRDPSQRLGAKCTYELKGHEFFNGLDFDAVLRREVEVPECSSFSAQSSRAESSRRQLRVESPFTSPRRMVGNPSAGSVSGWEFAIAPWASSHS